MVLSTFSVLALNIAVFRCSLEGIYSMLDTSSDDGYSRVLPEFVSRGYDESLHSNDARPRRSLLAAFPVWTSFDSIFLTVRSPLAHVELLCAAHLLVVCALLWSSIWLACRLVSKAFLRFRGGSFFSVFTCCGANLSRGLSV